MEERFTLSQPDNYSDSEASMQRKSRLSNPQLCTMRRHERHAAQGIGKRTGVFAIKAAIADTKARTFTFCAQKTMYGGRHIARGDTIFVFASENEGGPGLSLISNFTARQRTR